MNGWMNENQKNADCKERLKEQVAGILFLSTPSILLVCSLQMWRKLSRRVCRPLWLAEGWVRPWRYVLVNTAFWGQLLISWTFTLDMSFLELNLCKSRTPILLMSQWMAQDKIMAVYDSPHQGWSLQSLPNPRSTLFQIFLSNPSILEFLKVYNYQHLVR